MMRQWFWVLILVLPAPAMACGSVSMMLPRYWVPDVSLQEQAELLERVGCGDHTGYLPGADDVLIAKVAIDAIERDLPRSAIERLLQTYHCAYGARRRPDYAVIREFIGDDEFDAFCAVDKLERTYLIRPDSGVILRDRPSADGQRVEGMPKDAYVTVIAKHGDWFEVDGGLYGNGFIRKDLLVKY